MHGRDTLEHFFIAFSLLLFNKEDFGAEEVAANFIEILSADGFDFSSGTSASANRTIDVVVNCTNDLKVC
jgi:hypothetical protein